MRMVQSVSAVNNLNVGRLAERIVANELEARGFRVSDLNRDGLSANADLLAVGHDKVLQVQVMGATNAHEERWWVQYGYCTSEIIEKMEPMFNRHASFYRANIIVLVAVRAPNEYRCIVLRAEDAERAAQFNLDRDYRTPTKKGDKKKPHKVWVTLEPTPKESNRSQNALHLLHQEREIINRGQNAWEILLSLSVTSADAGE